MGRKQKTTKQLQDIVDKFNTRFPIGTQVELRHDTGWLITTVRGAAQVMGGHSAVAFFEGVRGAHSIEGDRVKGVFENCIGSGVPDVPTQS